MEKVLSRIDRQISVEKVIAVARAEGSQLGVKAATFHLTAPHASQVRHDAEGLADGWHAGGIAGL